MFTYFTDDLQTARRKLINRASGSVPVMQLLALTSRIHHRLTYELQALPGFTTPFLKGKVPESDAQSVIYTHTPSIAFRHLPQTKDVVNQCLECDLHQAVST